ncbi:hypothetical protein TRFO_36394 [Tritrichomonas foetus]|uniref:non-specific serine/threonine protein kinase n=1 Tax=Tritrichomonas foetus TaxID=1144522 RepID=A0A1J4JIN7_9EUKA|nr:hypothetical protein TRFO_36394 [Tritrichomonas foetus]|eukprot:OHS97389.1 hypothetical protein TRFO_36394 [Tritrichomonas foetus]
MVEIVKSFENNSSSSFLINPKNYQIVQQIGNGSFGVVYLVRDFITGKHYAMKYIQCNLMSKIQQQYLFREIDIMSKATHPALLHLHGYSLPSQNGDNCATIITQYMTKGSLFDLLKGNNANISSSFLDPTTRNIITIGIAAGMKHLHRHNIIHRDLKPENILLNENFEPFIGDFGLSKITQSSDGQANTTSIGTPLYMAPEIFMNDPYDFKVDVYAFGMIVYEILTSLEPFPDINNPMELGMKICNGERPSYPENFSPIFTTLIDRCLAQYPAHRPTFDDIVEYLYNPQVYVEGSDLTKINDYRKKVCHNDHEAEIAQIASYLQQQEKNIIQLQKDCEQSIEYYNYEMKTIKNELNCIKEERNEFTAIINHDLQKNDELITQVLKDHQHLTQEIMLLNV